MPALSKHLSSPGGGRGLLQGWWAGRRVADPLGRAPAFPRHPARAHQLSQLSKALLNFLNMCHIKIKFRTVMI